MHHPSFLVVSYMVSLERGEGGELSDDVKACEYISFAHLFDAIPMDSVKEALCATDRNDRRERELPRRYVVFLVIALAFFPNKSHREVFRSLVDCLKQIYGPLFEIKVPAKSSFSESRQALGFEPLAHLFKSVAVPVADLKVSADCSFKGYRLVGVDATQFAVPDTVENAAMFGRTKTANTPAAFPAVRVCGLVELGTRAMFDYEFGPVVEPEPLEKGQNKSLDSLREEFAEFIPRSRCSEIGLAKILLSRLRPGCLCLADRLYSYYETVKIATSTGAKILWRIRADLRLELVKQLPDGSYTAKLYEGGLSGAKENFEVVRVIEYEVGVGKSKQLYRLITTVEATEASRQELASLYHMRWEYETALSEQKNRFNFNLDVLRSKTPALVLQEVIALFLGHYATRVLMYRVAQKNNESSFALSMKHSIEVICRRSVQVGTGWSTEDVKEAIDREIMEEKVEKQPHRSNTRAVKSHKRKYEVSSKAKRPPGTFSYKKKEAKPSAIKMVTRAKSEFREKGRHTERPPRREAATKAERRHESRKTPGCR